MLSEMMSSSGGRERSVAVKWSTEKLSAWRTWDDGVG